MSGSASYKILIVDDKHSNLLTLRELITQYISTEVLEADCGDKALQLLNEQSVDLIILDVHMERMDGFELASLIKKRRKTRDIPIIFLTAAYINDAFKQRGFEVGAVDYLTKPIDEYQLINRINAYLKLIEKERSLNILLEQKVQEQTKVLLQQTEALKNQTLELMKAKEEAVAANAAKDLFLANISHELRTPLNILLSSTQLINFYLDSADHPVNRKLKDKINMQTQNCYRLLRLVNNLIDITKIDSGLFPLSFSECNIVQVIEAITQSVVEYVHTKGIKISFDTDVEEKSVNCDLDSIERIMLNLLSNAIKFTPKGGSIFVTITNLKSAVRISVKDTGIGVRENMLDIIFERFKQADSLLTRKNEGSGIGLSLVKALVGMHGGQIYVRSEYQSGSEFIVELPACNHFSFKEKSFHDSALDTTNENVIRKINIEFSDIYF